jgi:UDP-glucuronate decarboxylase
MKLANKIVLEDLETIARDLEKEWPKLEGATVLVTGGAGFIGNYLVATLLHLNKNHLTRPVKVISLDNFITGLRKPLLNLKVYRSFEFIEHDVCQPLRFRGKIDYIIHAAGLASPYYYRKYPLETIESAIWGAKNLLELSRLKQVKGILFLSSSEIYGDPDPQFVPTPETYTGNVSTVGPRACYDESKRLAETLCVTYHQKYQVPARIVRLFNAYGPGMKHVDYRVIPTFIYQGLRRRSLPVHDKGTQTRTFCYITDAITGMLKVLVSGKSGEVYNIGNNKPEITMHDLALRISKLLTDEVKPKRKPYPAAYPAGEPQRRCPDISKIKEELKYIPKVSLTSGLKKTIAWFKDHYRL